MNWLNVKLIFQRELRDQLRDRRTLFMIAILPLLLYPLIGVAFLHVSQFLKKNASRVLFVSHSPLDTSPALTEEGELAQGYQNAYDLLDVEVRHVSRNELARAAEIADRAMKQEGFDAVVVFPYGFQRQLEQLRPSDANPSDPARAPPGDPATQDNDAISDAESSSAGNSSPAVAPVESVLAREGQAALTSDLEPAIFFDAAKDRSSTAYQRVVGVLSDWRAEIVRTTLQEHQVPLQSANPFEIASQDVAKPARRRAALWSKILPFVVLVWALTGAFYPAVDLCAGEKERGTLETLLTGPAERIDIVWGKLLTIMVFSVSTALLNMICMVFTASLIFKQFEGLVPDSSSLVMGPPPLSSLAWLVVILIPISALFSALSLALATMARSTKEGQYYLMPLFLVSMPLLLVAILPSSELDLGSSLIPLTGVVLLLRQLIEGEFSAVLPYILPVMAVTAGCCWAAIRWAVDQFNDESVLFRESERLDVGLWLRHLLRDRSSTPSVAEALLCGVIILMVRFFGSMGLPSIQSWESFAQVAIISQVALFATPALLMAVMLTTDVWRTLLIRWPRLPSLLAAIALAVAIHPLAVGLTAVVTRLYPINTELPDIGGWIGQAPNWASVLLVLALLPAVCEELAFRGFILSGLRHTGSKWRAIFVSAAFFGVAHGIIQQSVTATFFGVILGYIAIQSGSLLPCICFHAVHNGLMVVSSIWQPQFRQNYPQWSWLFREVQADQTTVGVEYVYAWPVVAVAAVISFALLKYFRNLPFQPSAEERLHDAMDRPVAVPQKSVHA